MNFGSPFHKVVAEQRRKEREAFVRRYTRKSEAGIVPETDPRFEIVKPKTSHVIEAMHYRGFYCECRKPHSLWCVASTPDKRDIPSSLDGSFSNRERVLVAINNHIQQEQKEKEQEAHESPTD